MMGQWNNQVTTHKNIHLLAKRLNSSLTIDQINAYAIQRKWGQEFWAVPDGANSGSANLRVYDTTLGPNAPRRVILPKKADLLKLCSAL